MSNELQRTDKTEKELEFTPFGSQDKIKLSIKIIQNLVAVPTKSGKTCSERDAMKFMMFCLAQKLNPFDQDAYLVGYETDGIAQFTMLAAEKSLLKRAELHPEYDGMESGLTVIKDDDTYQDVEGELVPPGTRVVAGWCRVHFKSRKFPCYDRLPLDKMAAGKWGPFWKNNPEHQIVKCTRAAVLRRAFPTSIGGLFLREEIEMPTNGGDAHDMTVTALPATASSQTATEAKAELAGTSADASANPVNNLRDYVLGEKFTFEQFRTWGLRSGNLDETVNSFEEVPANVATRLLRAKSGLLKGLQMVREEASNEP